MRPRRSPGLRAGSVWTDPGREPGVTGSGLTPGPELTPGAMGADGPAREGGESGSRLAIILRADMRPFLHAHHVQCPAPRQPPSQPFPDIHGERVACCATATFRELIDGIVDT